MWRQKYSVWLETAKYWKESNKARAFTLVLVHCMPELEGKLEGMDGHEKIKAKQVVIKFLEMIQSISHGQDETT